MKHPNQMTLEEAREMLWRNPAVQSYIQAIKIEIFEELERIKKFNLSEETKQIQEAHRLASEKRQKKYKEPEPNFQLPE